MIEIFLKNGGNLKSYNDYNGWNALHYAVFYRKLDTVKYLISIGIEIIKSKNNKTPLDLAKDRNMDDLVRYFSSIDIVC